MGNPLQQLDLFGMPVEASTSPKLKKQAIKKGTELTQPIQEALPTHLSQSVDPIEIEDPIKIEDPIQIKVDPTEINETATEEPVVYASSQIVVKVKTEKAKPKPVLVTLEPPVTTKVKASEKIKEVGKRGRKSFKEMDAVADLIEIPTEEVLKEKLYYSISEVASWFKVNTSLLRYWENEFDILQPRKTRKGDRLFRVEDIKNLQLIYLLLRQRKFSIEGAKSYLKNNKNKIDTETQLVQSLTKFKQFLLELKSSLSN
ncbi:MAG TPA: MerR family transcriptional regulator [Sediminibacterium sp.]|uniref:MerR family transcriptional regulator n=1 Tax=Sediminibacterium sp. TaxID=1917865 RepID=UPI000A4869BD|nr:MerR family transcriptional regulator [Sediminibacterium sp.]HLD54444.1 MerR family transcriptional regulator [Sediminibacterium sp.]